MKFGRPLFDTSAFNWFKIRDSNKSKFRHPFSFRPVDHTPKQNHTIPTHEIGDVARLLSSSMIAGTALARYLIDSGRVELRAKSGDGSRSVSRKFSDVFLDGLSVDELMRSHCVMYKPVGVACGQIVGIPELTSMFFGYISPANQKLSGLHLRMNNYRVAQRLESSKLERVYLVTVSEGKPLSPNQISSLKLRAPSVEIVATQTNDSNTLFPSGSSYCLRLRTRDDRPSLLRYMFKEFAIQDIRLESIGNLSLKNIGLLSPNSFKFIEISVIESLLFS